MKLGHRQRLFVHEYFIDLNATKAAIRAGYSKKTANKIGPRLLVNVGIRKAIAIEQAKRSEKLEITADMWLRELWLIYKADIKNYIETEKDTGTIRVKYLEELPEGLSRALESITENRTVREDAKGEDSIINDRVTFKMHDKLKAGELIGKHLGFLRDKFEGTLDIRAKLSMADLRKSIKESENGS